MDKKIIFFAKNAGFIRFNKDILTSLAQSNKIYIFFETRKVLDEEGILEFFKANYSNKIFFIYNEKKFNTLKITNFLKRVLDFLHYLNPEYKDRKILKRNFYSKINISNKKFLTKFTISEKLRLNLIKFLKFVIYSISYDNFVISNIKKIKPDISIFTNLVWPLTPQTEYLNICKKKNIKSLYFVNSWDNLTNKGGLKSDPNFIFVWNKEQKKELKTFHNYQKKIIITGSPTYFKWKKKIKFYKKDFLLKIVELKNINKIIITYLCSSPTICPGDTEVKFVKDWIKKIRFSKNEKIKNSNIIIRPHPQNNNVWKKFNETNCSVYPKINTWVVKKKNIEDFYNCVKHSTFVVGKNTSNMIEAGIIGKKVFTVLDKFFKSSNSIHYNYLKKYKITKEAKNLSQHMKQIESFMKNRRYLNDSINKFVFPSNTNPLKIVEVNINKIFLNETREYNEPS